jgi:hypothetical protein
MAYLDHGLPAAIAGGILSEAHVTWDFARDDGDRIRFTWDLGHTVTARSSDGALLDEWQVGDPNKATTSRRTVENSIRAFLRERHDD